jgi:hypothetical protein
MPCQAQDDRAQLGLERGRLQMGVQALEGHGQPVGPDEHRVAGGHGHRAFGQGQRGLLRRIGRWLRGIAPRQQGVDVARNAEHIAFPKQQIAILVVQQPRSGSFSTKSLWRMRRMSKISPSKMRRPFFMRSISNVQTHLLTV